MTQEVKKLFCDLLKEAHEKKDYELAERIVDAIIELSSASTYYYPYPYYTGGAVWDGEKLVFTNGQPVDSGGARG